MAAETHTLDVKKNGKLPILLRVGLFWLVFAGTFAVVQPAFSNYTIYPSPLRKLWEQRPLPRNSVDIFYVGSSHIGGGVQPLVIEDITGLDGINLTLPAADITTAYYLTRDAFQKQSPRYVVFEVSSLLLNEASPDYFCMVAENLSTISRTQFLLSKMPPAEALGIALPLIHNHTFWKEDPAVLAKTWREVTFKSVILGNRAFWGFPLAVSQDQFDEINIQAEEEDWIGNPATTLPPDRQEMLDAFIRLCQQQGAQPIFIRALNVPGQVQGPFIWAEEYAASHGISYLDLNNEIPAETLTRVTLRDSHHLSINGTLPANLVLAGFLSETFGLPFDEYAADLYASLFVRDVAVNQVGNQIKVLLQMEQGDAHIQVAWRHYRDENLMDTTFFQTDNLTYTFYAEEGVDYSVQFMLRPAIDPDRITIKTKYPLF